MSPYNENPKTATSPYSHASLPLRSSSPLAPGPSPTPPTRTILLSHPSACLSSSPASSPRVVDSPLARTRSVRPEMSRADFMNQGVPPGADFFEADSSSENEASRFDDEEQWEDDNGTRDFFGLGIIEDPNSVSGETNAQILRGQPPFNQIPAHDSGTGLSDGDREGAHDMEEEEEEEQREGRMGRGTNKARQMSLRRLGKVKVVHNQGSGSAGNGTPRESLMNDDSAHTSPIAGLREGDSGKATKKHRRNTNESLDVVLKTHAITMRALETISPSASLSLAHGPLHSQRLSSSHTQPGSLQSPSLTANRRINIAEISRTDPDRPVHLPTSFIKTPYPFSDERECSKPRTRPRSHAPGHAKGLKARQVIGLEPSASDQWSVKGKQVLGLVASDGEYDVRSKFTQGTNRDLQTVKRAQSDGAHRKRGPSWGDGEEGVRKSVVLLSLWDGSGRCSVSNRVEKIVIPSSLTTKGSERAAKRKPDNEEEGDGGKTMMVDFDDCLFAERLREGYRVLSGSWFRRVFGTRQLRKIQLGRISTWSGTSGHGTTWFPSHTHYQASLMSPTTRLLATGGGFDSGTTPSPFTEVKLMDLYRNPKSGKARYTWVHWARRVAASNGALESAASVTAVNSKRRIKSVQGLSDLGGHDIPIHGQLHASRLDEPVTIQFVQTLSLSRVLCFLTVSLVVSVAAALLWILLGESGWSRLQAGGRGERVGPGMLVGMLVLAVEVVAFAAWLGWSRLVVYRRISVTSS